MDELKRGETLTTSAMFVYCVAQSGLRCCIAPVAVVNVTTGSRTYPTDQTTGFDVDEIVPRSMAMAKTVNTLGKRRVGVSSAAQEQPRGTAYGEMGANAVLAVLARMPFFTNAERVFWSVSICHDTPVFCR